VWAGTADDALEGFFRFDRNMDENRATISAPEDVVAAMDLPAGTIGVVGGRPLVVRAGIQQTAFDCTDLIAMPCARAPRTAVALSVDRQTLWLAVVDGWQAASLGMTAAELGSFLEQRGAHDALLLDGGASSALCVDGAVASEPSDGVERSVANHLGVLHGTLPPGELFGVTFECELITGPIVSGVRVELDDGQSVVTGADGRYTFTNLTPRYACVTASKLGYVTKTQCKQVAPGVITYNSIDLAPESGCPMVDAGPTPDAGPDPDAAPADAAATDGGPGGDGGGDGCGCRAAGDASFAWLVAWALAVLLTSGTKRRSR
jgi:MYXO-CTERM domain-containing protein